MNEDSRIRIATAEGWTFSRPDHGKEMDLGSTIIIHGETVRKMTMWGTPPKAWRWHAVNFDVPDYANDLYAIQRAVLAQDEEFREAFSVALTGLALRERRRIAELTADDWCACFIAVLDEKGKK